MPVLSKIPSALPFFDIRLDSGIELGYGHDHLPGFLKTYQGQINKLTQICINKPGGVTTIIPHPKTKRNGTLTDTRTFSIVIDNVVQCLVSFRTDRLDPMDVQDAIDAFGSDVVPMSVEFPDEDAAKDGIYIYVTKHIKGVAWEKLSAGGRDPFKDLVNILPSLGRILTQTLPCGPKFGVNEQLEEIAAHVNIILNDHSPEVCR